MRSIAVKFLAFVGQTGKEAEEPEVLLWNAERLRANPDPPLKLLISGSPGIGKTRLVNFVGNTLASHPAAIEDGGGLEVRLDLDRIRPGHPFLRTPNLDIDIDIDNLTERFQSQSRHGGFGDRVGVIARLKSSKITSLPADKKQHCLAS